MSILFSYELCAVSVYSVMWQSPQNNKNRSGKQVYSHIISTIDQASCVFKELEQLYKVNLIMGAEIT